MSQEEWHWDPQEAASENEVCPKPPVPPDATEAADMPAPPNATVSPDTPAPFDAVGAVSPDAVGTAPAPTPDFTPNAAPAECTSCPTPAKDDRDTPLWQAVIGPMTPPEWKKVHRRVAFGWSYALCVIFALWLGQSALIGTIDIGGMSLYRGLIFLPLHLILLVVSFVGYTLFKRRCAAREQYEYAIYGWADAAGRTVTVYNDRIEAVGLRDTVTVPFDGAVLREWQEVLTVENNGACVVIRAADITAGETAALTALLYPRIRDCRGKKPFYSYQQALPHRRPAPCQRQDMPEFVTRCTYTRAAAVQRRLSALYGRQWLMWLPLIATFALTLTDAWTSGDSNLLYYLVTLLAVLLLSSILAGVFVVCGTLDGRKRFCSFELRFYSDRLVVKTPTKDVVCPREMMALRLDDTHLTLETPLQGWELPLKEVQDAAALCRFLTGQD